LDHENNIVQVQEGSELIFFFFVNVETKNDYFYEIN